MSIAIQIGQIMFPLIAIVSVGLLIGVRKHPDLDHGSDDAGGGAGGVDPGHRQGAPGPRGAGRDFRPDRLRF